MIRAIYARSILIALSCAAEAGPVFYAVNRCIRELDAIVKAEEVESARGRSIGDLEISIRLRCFLDQLNCKTVRDAEVVLAQDVWAKNKKIQRELRKILESTGVIGATTMTFHPSRDFHPSEKP